MATLDNPSPNDDRILTDNWHNIQQSFVTARISPQILDKVTRLFNASLTDILHELLQNARRARASQVEITLTDPGYLRVEDNGCGITDPQTLLTLGESAWDGNIIEREDAAGMGIFSLSNRGALIASQSWRVHLDSDTFSGTAIAPIQTCDHRVGTLIEFPLKADELAALSMRLKAITEYYPVPVQFNGEELTHQNFLEHGNFIVEWQGMRLGVSARSDWSSNYRSGTINFHGVTVNQALPELTCNDSTWKVRVDVIDSPELKLVLPARKEVVQDEFFQQLQVECRKALYQYVQTLEHHDLPYVRWLEARSFGVDLPVAKSSLTPFYPAVCDHLREWDYPQPEAVPVDSTAVLLYLRGQDAIKQQLAYRALESSGLNYRFFDVNIEYQGYAWYDHLPQLKISHYEIEVEGETLTLQDFHETYSHKLSVTVDRINMIAVLEQPGQTPTEIRCPLDVCFVPLQESSYSWDELDSATIAIAQGAKLEVAELAELLKNCYFHPSEDSDADSYATQLEDFEEAAQERAIKALLTEEAALKARIEMVLERHLRWILPSNQKLVVQVTPMDKGDQKFEVHLAERDKLSED